MKNNSTQLSVLDIYQPLSDRENGGKRDWFLHREPKRCIGKVNNENKNIYVTCLSLSFWKGIWIRAKMVCLATLVWRSVNNDALIASRTFPFIFISPAVLMVDMKTNNYYWNNMNGNTRHDKCVVIYGASEKANRFRSDSNTLLKRQRKTSNKYFHFHD